VLKAESRSQNPESRRKGLVTVDAVDFTAEDALRRVSLAQDRRRDAEENKSWVYFKLGTWNLELAGMPFP
jgi:hypothetical protein